VRWSLHSRILCFSLLAVFCLCAFAFTTDDETGADASKIIAMEKAWGQAFKLHDLAAMSALLADNVVVVNDDGTFQNKAEYMAWFQSSRQAAEDQVIPESISVYMTGSVAVATGVFRTTTVQNGKELRHSDRFADTWVNRGGRWVCVSASATPVLR
jgi:ketosteroid isomerase-like protein